MGKVLIFLLFALLLITSVNARVFINSIDIKESFMEGDTISFDYSIFSDEELLVRFIPGVICEDFPAATLDLEEKLIHGTFLGTYFHGQVMPGYDYKNCYAIVEILEPEPFVYEKSFTVIATPEIDFEFKMCLSKACVKNSRLFHTGDNIFLEIFGENINAKATLTYPGGEKRLISIPKIIELNDIGTYSINITATKKGHMTKQINEQFAVLDIFPVVILESECNGDLICDKGEDAINCPQDCKPANLVWVLVFPLIALLFIGGIVLWLHQKE